MPVWNVEGCIGEAIESVLAQTYDSWELLLIDYGSTDGSSAGALRALARRVLPASLANSLRKR